MKGRCHSLEQDIGTEQLGISQLQNDIQYNQDVQMNSAEDIAQQQVNLDNAELDYQSAVDRDNAYNNAKEDIPNEDKPKEEIPNEDGPREEIPNEEARPKEDIPNGERPKEEIPNEETPPAEPGAPSDGTEAPPAQSPDSKENQETQDPKKPDTPEPDKQENPFKQRFLDQLTARGYSQEDALKEWQDLVNSRDKKEIGIITSQLEDHQDLAYAKYMADLDKRMRTATDAGATALVIAGLVQAARLGLEYALSKAAEAEAAGERGLVSLWNKVASFLKGGGTAAEGEAAAPSASGTAGTRVWDSGPGPRGEAIEAALGKNLPSNYPIIDKFENGVATSIKSMDLGAKTYQDPGEIARIGRGYIDKVADFQGARWGRVNIEPENITGRALDLACTTRGYRVSTGRTPAVDRIWCTKRCESEDCNDTMKSAAAYKRGQKIYLDPESRTTAGVWIGTGPVIVLEESESPSRKGNCLREVLRHSQEGVPHPTNWTILTHLSWIWQASSLGQSLQNLRCAALFILKAINWSLCRLRIWEQKAGMYKSRIEKWPFLSTHLMKN